MHKRRPRPARCCSCCGSRFSVSSSSSSEPESRSLSYLTHEMVQARLERMISSRRTETEQRQLVVLVATDRSSYDRRTDFRDSMTDVIESKGMKEPKELRTLLNCYLSLNSREHRQVILEAFHDVCTRLFPV